VIPEPATPRRSLDAILRQAETLQQQPAGTILFEEGEPTRGLYVVHSGSIHLLFKARSSTLKGVRATSVGEILGLDEVVSCRPHEYTARVIKASALGFIDKESFTQMLADNPELWLDVLRLLSHDVNASYDFLRNAGVARARPGSAW
jgi:CRP-like cAMP-binding protein